MSQYGRIGKRRSGSATWQWMLLGFFPGILCGGVLIFAMFASGALNSLTAASLPSPTAFIIKEVQIVTATASITPDVSATPESVAVTPDTPVGTASGSTLPTSTPLIIVSTATSGAVSVGPTATSPLAGAQSFEGTIVAGVNPLPTIAGAQADVPTSGIPAILQSGLTNLITIPSGTFTMGTDAQEILQAVAECVDRDVGNCLESDGTDSTPQIQVRLDSYQMEVTEVTFAQYIAFLNYLRSQGTSHKDACPSPNGASTLCIQTTNENPTDAVVTFDSINYNVSPGLLQHPVYGVTWAGAQAYCEAIGRRLPTEAEWEYAAKGNDPGRIYPWGNLWNPANAKTRIPKDIPPGTMAVGSYQGGVTPNGLFDMAGNVSEWVIDWYGEAYYSELLNQTQPVSNPQGPIQGINKVMRGGSWDTLPFFTRTVHRLFNQPAPDGNGTTFPRSIGFRCAAAVGENVVVPTVPTVTSGTVNPANLGANVPLVAPTASSGAEGTTMPGSGSPG